MVESSGADPAPGMDAVAAPSSAVELLLRFTRVRARGGISDRRSRGAGACACGSAGARRGAGLRHADAWSRSRSGASRISAATRFACARASVDLDAIARLDDLVQDVLDGRLDAGCRARASSTEIRATPLERPWPLLLARLRDRRRGADAGARRRLARGGGRRARRARRGRNRYSDASRTARTEQMVAPIAAVAASFSPARSPGSASRPRPRSSRWRPWSRSCPACG